MPIKKTPRQIRAILRAWPYILSVHLKMPISWQVSLLPKSFFSKKVCTIQLQHIKLYSSSDPSPPRHSFRFCFKSTEEKKMSPITSIFSEMTDDSPRSCVHNTLRDLFIDGKDFKTTSQYKRMLLSLSQDNTLYKCQSNKDIDLYFENLFQVYRSIKEDGYKSQQELGGGPKDEIRVHITENGTLCLGSKGNHRFRIAELLGVQQIPCLIYGVNRSWLISSSKKSKQPAHKALLNWMKNQNKPHM